MSGEENENLVTSSESSSDTDDETIHDIPDEEFFKTLSCLKTKDPRIYDDSIQFFQKPPLVTKNSKKLKIENRTEIEEEEKDKPTELLITTNNTGTNKKFSLKDFDNDLSSDDEISAFKNDADEKEVEDEAEHEYIQFLKGRKTNIEDKEAETTLKPLQDYWNTKELDENEKFLKDYILNKKYLARVAEVKAEDENLSEDERELEEQAEYEANYNFRFENEENLQIKRYPRTVEGSIRRKNDTRSKKRTEIAQRKKEEKMQKQQEIKKKQKQKLSEIEERLQKLKELTGNVELGFKDEEILEDFDPQKHDKKMNELFNDDYYNEGDTEKPVFNDDDDESYWNDNINMDCDADISSEKINKLTRTQKKKLRKKKTYKDIMDLAKPKFDPKIHNDFKKYIDEYYGLDCEDFIDDIPCKFKYREVVPNDYGLSIEEILMADDSELNRWASVKKIIKRRPEHVESNEVKIYRKKSHDEYLKRKMLPSLYMNSQETEEQTDNNDTNLLTVESNKCSIEAVEFIKGEDHNSNEEDGQLTEGAFGSKNNDINKDNKRKRKKKNKGDTKQAKTMDAMLDEMQPNNMIDEAQLTNTSQNGNVTNSTDGKNISARQKKNRRIKRKKLLNLMNSENKLKHKDTKIEKSALNNENVEQSKKNLNENGNNIQNKDVKTNIKGKINVKSKKKFGFKKKKEGIVNLSDNRLLAYGIKPKQFRSKILYSKKSETS